MSAKGFKKCCTFNAVDGAGDDILWNGREEVGSVKSECEMKAVTVKMETVTITD